MRVLFADSNHPILHKTLIHAGFECALHWEKSTAELLNEIHLYDILVIRSRFRLDAPTINRASKLTCIARVGAGLENIDTDHCETKGIKCISVPEGNRDAVGEHALGMLLMLMNNLKKADQEVRRGVWLRAENRGHEIKERTVGIIGYGNMGSAFAEKLRGFGCKILAYDKYKHGFGNALVNECTIETLYHECDILSIHVPLTVETQYLVNNDFLGRFRKNIYLVNTSRGKCLNTAHLVDSILNGKVIGACLDVLEYESSSFEKMDNDSLPAPMKFLTESDKVILSPHIAGWTYESNYRMSRLIAEKIIAAFGAKN